MNDVKIQRGLHQQIGIRLSQSPPGRAAQSRFAPQLGYGRHFGPPPHDARKAAVILLFCGQGKDAFVPLTLRPGHLKQHGGQICLPGGMLEAGEDVEQGALRELQEEIGVAPEQVQVLGRLSPLFVFASNNWITPVVGGLAHSPEFVLNPGEVESLLRVPVTQMVDSRFHDSRPRTVRGIEFKAPFIAHQEHQIWGATSMILGEMIAVLNSIGVN